MEIDIAVSFGHIIIQIVSFGFLPLQIGQIERENYGVSNAQYFTRGERWSISTILHDTFLGF